MKRLVLSAVLCFTFIIPGYAQKATGPKNSESAPAYWGFTGSIEMGGMRIEKDSFRAVADAGYGTVGTGSITAQFTAGMNYRKPDVFDFALLCSYLGGGSFVWENIFGDPGSNFSLYGDSLALQIEYQPLYPALHGFHPFIGAGYSLTNGLVDNFGDGFVAGRGPFLVGGLYIFNSFGLDPYLPFSSDDDSFFGLRISVYYRFPYAYSFRLDWDEFYDNYAGPSDPETMRSFFENTAFESSSLAFSIGVSLGYAPFPAGKTPSTRAGGKK